MKKKVKSLLSLLRVHQYIKNIFVFLPLFFALNITNLKLLQISFVAFAAFCLIASAVYIFNDIKDLEEDKKHYSKKTRPLASGEISIKTALILMAVCLLAGLGIAYLLNIKLFLILGLYIILNVLYSLKLKYVSIADVFIVALGFVLRVLAGGILIGVQVTYWILIMTFLLALFLAFAKRRDDLIYNNDSQKVKKTPYNLAFIDIAIAITATITIVFYILYTVSPEIIAKFHSTNIYITSLFVIFGIMRYLQITFVEQKSGCPTSVALKDRTIQLTILGWVITFLLLIY